MFYSKKLLRFKNIRHCFFSRRGGCSKGIYKSLNCGRGSKDRKKNVTKNLENVSKKMFVKKSNLILMHQTHSNKVIEIKKNNFKKKIVCDAMITRKSGLALSVVTADCVPILLYDENNKIIGCIHAGWRGALSGIIKNTIFKMRKIGSNNKIFASIGPCIDKKNYEVDLNFVNRFMRKSKKNKRYFSVKNKNKRLFNLRQFVANQLLELKVIIDHINRDTFKEKNNFFSYRRSTLLKHNDYGRCISIIRLV